MTLDYLAEALAKNPELFDKQDITWYIIKCADPVGTRLNEGWFKGPFTPQNYSKHFYRPAFYEQVEWTFPIQYKTLSFSKPLPETQALMNVIEEAKPDFMYSLHNGGFGGAFYYVSRDLPHTYQKLRDHATKRGLPLHLGEPEMPFVKRFSDAIYKLPNITDMYDFFAANSKSDPAAAISSGTCSMDYLKKFNPNSFTLVCELPYFYDRQIEDTSELDFSQRDSLLMGIDFEREFLQTLEANFEPHLESLKPSRFLNAVQEYLQTARPNLEAKQMWISSHQEFDRTVTVAQHFDNVTNVRFYRMLILGMAVRAMELMLPYISQTDTTQLIASKETIQTYMDTLNNQLENELDYQVVPIKTLIQIQLAAALEVLQALI